MEGCGIDFWWAWPGKVKNLNHRRNSLPAVAFDIYKLPIGVGGVICSLARFRNLSIYSPATADL